MCGIFAYTGKKDCREMLVNGLRTLEYRGYDSAGLVCLDEAKRVFLQKAVGRVSSLASKVEAHADEAVYNTGIAHTRWATHGGVTEANTHPHASANQRFYVVHNGIIENYKELKKTLEEDYDFYSQTDTEVIAKLIEASYTGNLKTTMEAVAKKLVGAYSVAVIDTQSPGEMVGIKLGSPLIVGKSEDGVFIASDVNALASLAESYTILEDHEMVVISRGDYKVYMAGDEMDKVEEKLELSETLHELGNFSSFTEKEIYEIPNILENVFSGRIDFESKDIKNETLEQLSEAHIERVVVIASGSSYYAGDTGCYFFRRFAGIPASAVISSEFLADNFIPEKNALYVFLSQSGETADVRESMKIVQAKGCKTFAIVNVVGSTIARMADYGLYSHSGVEIGVASTKNVIAQIGVLLMTALAFGKKRDLQISEIREIISELAALPDKIHEVLMKAPSIRETSKKYKDYEHMFVLGRNMFYPVAGEASLKCKELSYIHCESYSAGELKHGPLALVSEAFPVVVFNPMGKYYSKTVSNIQEVVARK